MCGVRGFALAAFLIAVAFTVSDGARRPGGGARHSYPSHSGLSGHGSSGGSHGYPASHGLSGGGGGHQPHQQQHHTSVQSAPPSGHQPGGGAHSYPNSPGLSGSGGHSYPKSPGLSGNGGGHTGHGGGATNVHYHQHVYSPPQQIHYTPVHGAPPAHPYPVYHGQPPVYVHEIRDSGSRFSTLLTGLALYNLGRSASGFHGHHSTNSAPQQDAPGEKCTLRIEQDKNLERVKIPCYIVSTFTDAHDVKSALNATSNSSTTVAPSVSSSPADVSTALPVITNVSLMTNNTAMNATSVNATADGNTTLGNSSLITQNTTLTPSTTPAPTSEPVEAVKLKGEPVQLKTDARCFVEKETKTSSSRKEIECGLLQQYALQSMQKQQQPRHHVSLASTFTSHFAILSLSVVTYFVVQ